VGAVSHWQLSERAVYFVFPVSPFFFFLGGAAGVNCEFGRVRMDQDWHYLALLRGKRKRQAASHFSVVGRRQSLAVAVAVPVPVLSVSVVLSSWSVTDWPWPWGPAVRFWCPQIYARRTKGLSQKKIGSADSPPPRWPPGSGFLSVARGRAA
jgi:hypothetical protein